MIEYSESDHGATIRIVGRFDFSTHRDFDKAVARTRTRRVTIDFGNVDYIDSSALGMLLLLREQIGEGADIRLAGLVGQPRDVLRLARFDRLFTLE